MTSTPEGTTPRRVHAFHRRNSSDWARCSVDDCNGIHVPGGAGLCLRHVDPATREQVFATWEGGHPVDLRGTTFEAGLFDQLVSHLRATKRTTRTGTWDFQRCRFTEPVDFARFVFGAPELRGRTQAHVDFSEAAFEDDSVFDRAQFNLPVFAVGTIFTTVSFDLAEFHHDAWFLDARFGKAAFADTNFSAGAHFDDVTADSLVFAGAHFDGPAHIKPVRAAHLDLSSTEFSERVNLHLVAGSGTLDQARFAKGVDVTLVPPPTSGNEVDDGTSPDTTNRMTLSLAGTRFEVDSTVTGDMRLQRTPDDRSEFPQFPKLTSFAGTDVGHLTVADVALSSCRFAGAINLDKLRLIGRTPFARPTRGELRDELLQMHVLLLRPWRRRLAPGLEVMRTRWDRRPAGQELLYEDYLIRSGQTNYMKIGDRPRVIGEWATDDQLAALYRALRKALEDAKNEPGAGDMYYGEMEARRRSSREHRRWAEWTVLVLYRALSGYGQRAGRAVIWLLVLLSTLVVLLMGAGLPDTAAPAQRMTGTVTTGPSGTPPYEVALEVRNPPTSLSPRTAPWTLDRFERAARIAVGSVLFRDTDQQLTTAGRWTVNTGRLLGPVLLALAALAVRARVKR